MFIRWFPATIGTHLVFLKFKMNDAELKAKMNDALTRADKLNITINELLLCIKANGASHVDHVMWLHQAIKLQKEWIEVMKEYREAFNELYHKQ